MQTTQGLTAGYSQELDRQITKTYEGQAHFAGTGPSGGTCGDCVCLSYWKQRRSRNGDIIGTQRRLGCAKFHELTGKHGPTVPKHAEACKYFRKDGDK